MYFQENNCRLCKKVFCCVECRLRHEETVHKINPECDICVYGRISAKVLPEKLLSHILAVHFPLHCLLCKKMFNSAEDFSHQDKCTNNVYKSPRTPVNSNLDNLTSNLLTPHFNNDLPSNHKIGLSITLAATSTPLLSREELEKGETPSIESSKFNYVYKSSLKLTGSSTLNESKRSDRKVTFSETPIIVPEKKIKCQIMQMSAEHTDEESSDDSFVSVKEITDFSDNSACKENCKPRLSYESENNSWKTARTSFEMNSSLKLIESIDNEASNFLLTSNLNVQVKTNKKIFKPSGLWSSMTNIMKSVIPNISLTGSSTSLPAPSLKRMLSESDMDGPRLKRMKLTDIKCRRPIRDLPPVEQIRLASKRYVDKATQTDD